MQSLTSGSLRKNIEKQKRLMEKLSATCPHSIKLIKELAFGYSSASNYNCFMYAFNLLNVPEIDQISSGYPNIFPGSEFVQFAISNQCLSEISCHCADDDDIVVYFSKGPTHAGKLKKGKILSKWGTGNLWEHDIYEVPCSYGDEVKCFEKIDRIRAINCFISYAVLKGGLPPGILISPSPSILSH